MTSRHFIMRALKPVLRHSPHFFEHFGGYFLSLGSKVAKLRAKTFLCWYWNRFYSILALLWALWWLLCLNQTYCCKNSGRNIFFGLRKLLRHSPHIFEHFGCYFGSIRCTAAKIWAKTYVLPFSKPALCNKPFFEHFGSYLASIKRTVHKIRAETYPRGNWN